MNLSEKKRNILGVIVLLCVNIIWVSSSELTRYIFKNQKYDKPFLSTYLKSCMFSLFLMGFLFNFRWRKLACPHKFNYNEIIIEPPIDDEERDEFNRDSLGDPVYVPINTQISEDESSAKLGEEEFVMIDKGDYPEEVPRNRKETVSENRRSVKFNSTVEIRQLSGTYAEESVEARMGFQATERYRRRLIIQKLYENGIYPASLVLKLALQFCFCWFIASYAYQKALSQSMPAVVNVLSSSSSLFTLILASLFPSSEKDKFTITKLLVVFLSISGVIIISFGDSLSSAKFEIGGIIWSLVGAAGYAIYLVLLRRQVTDENQMSLLMFLGFVGIWTMVLLWPVGIILHWADVEKFEVPNTKQLLMLLLNGIIGTVGAELLWLWGCFLTSSLTATLALGLTIPLSMVFDLIIYKKTYQWVFYVGGIPILLSFIAINYLSSGNGPSPDPIGRFIKFIFIGRRRPVTQYEPLVNTDMDEDENDDDKCNNSINNDPPQPNQIQTNISLVNGLSNLISTPTNQNDRQKLIDDVDLSINSTDLVTKIER